MTQYLNSTLSDGMDLIDVVMFAYRRATVHRGRLQRTHDERSKIRRSHGIPSILRRRHTDNDVADTVCSPFVIISSKS